MKQLISLITSIIIISAFLLVPANAVGSYGYYNIIFVAPRTTEIEQSINSFIQISKSESWNIETHYITSFKGIEAGTLAYKCDISLEINKAISAYYNKNIENYVFVMAEEDLIYSDTPTALNLRSKVLNYASGKIHLSIVSDYSSLPKESFFAQIIDKTSGTLFNKNGYNAPSDLAWDIYKWLTGAAEFKYISSVGLTKMPATFNNTYLQNIYNTQSSSEDYDKDGLSDFSEIAFDSGLITTSSTLQMPTIQECMTYVAENEKALYVEDAFKRFETSEWKNEQENGGYDNFNDLIKNVRIVPIDSDPVLADSDGDYMLDNYDNNLDKTNYWEDTNDPNPLYAYYNTSNFYGQNAVGITVKKTTKKPEDFVIKKSVQLEYNVSQNNSGTIGMKKLSAGDTAIRILPFPYELQEYIQSCCDSAIEDAEKRGLPADRIALMKELLTPETIIAIGVTESSWQYKRKVGSNIVGVNTSYTGLIREGIDVLPNTIGGSGAINEKSKDYLYANIYCSVSGAVCTLAHGMGYLGGSNISYYNNGETYTSEDESEQLLLFDSYYAYGEGTRLNYNAGQGRITAVCKLYAFYEIKRQNNKSIWGNLQLETLQENIQNFVGGEEVVKFIWTPIEHSQGRTDVELPSPNSPKTSVPKP
jgi:hypothetical protein